MKRKYVKPSPLQVIHQQYFLDKGRVIASIANLTNIANMYNASNGMISTLESIQERLLKRVLHMYLKRKEIIRGGSKV